MAETSKCHSGDYGIGRFSCRCFLLAVLCISVAVCGGAAIADLELLAGRWDHPLRMAIPIILLVQWLLGITAFFASIVGLLTGLDGLISRGTCDAESGICALGFVLNGTLLGGPLLVVLLA